MKNIQPIFSLLIIVSIVFLLSCDENDDPINIEGDVELFLIEKFEK